MTEAEAVQLRWGFVLVIYFIVSAFGTQAFINRQQLGRAVIWKLGMIALPICFILLMRKGVA